MHREPGEVRDALVLDLDVVDRVPGEGVGFTRDEAPERVELHLGVLQRAVGEQQLVGGLIAHPSTVLRTPRGFQPRQRIRACAIA